MHTRYEFVDASSRIVLASVILYGDATDAEKILYALMQEAIAVSALIGGQKQEIIIRRHAVSLS